MFDPESDPTSAPPDSTRQREFLILIAGLLLGFLLARFCLFLSEGRQSRHFELVRELVGRNFVDPTQDDELVESALQGMLDGLDDYSRYYTGEEIARLDRETTGLYRGIGILFRPPTDLGQVLFPLPNSPAERAGIRVGDRLLHVDSQSIAEMPPGGLSKALRRDDATEFELELESLDGTARTVAVRPEPVVDPTVRHARFIDRDAGLAYVAVLSFSKQTPDELDRAVAELREVGLRSLVLDLRANPGGVLSSAIEVANRFIKSGVIVTTTSRDRDHQYEAEPDLATMLDIELAVLIDGDSASASEVLAGALQDHRVAVVLGEPSYGKGVVQTLTRFDEDGAVMKLTTSRYYTPAHRRIDAHRDAPERAGIAPDLRVDVAPEVATTLLRHRRGFSPPLSLVAAIEAWELQLGKSLYTRHPPDPVLDAAVELLAGRIPSGRKAASMPQ